uniref:AlNc14C159G7721 protein n=1 Tax=Albugo laibachii Nc14 TaxID=890382 RepID=F0WMN3_9STRA|nr:AlNc14C159G7721 [Albugo laibachii Nc14]|eukprot:CCA22567.1 AlNc14C159G7721 [Albugo laibachii Nc14]
MAENAELTAEERKSILTLRAAGLTVRGIAEATKRCVGVCSKVLSAQPNSNKPSRRGCKPKISERDRRHIIRLVSAGDLIAAKVKAKLKLTYRVRTIQRVLMSVDWLS